MVSNLVSSSWRDVTIGGRRKVGMLFNCCEILHAPVLKLRRVRRRIVTRQDPELRFLRDDGAARLFANFCRASSEEASACTAAQWVITGLMCVLAA